MIDLFSIILSGGISWGMGKIFDSLVGCRCGNYQERRMVNVEYNQFQCHSCKRTLSEYVNATNHTVNSNHSVVAAAVYDTSWPEWSGTFRLNYKLDVINSAYQEVVVELVLSEYQGRTFYSYRTILTPNSPYTNWNNNWFSVDAKCFPQQDSPVAVDLNTYNVWGERLHRHRRLMEYSWGHKSIGGL